ncbi:DNA-binding response regulator [Clostridium gelidum]|uniref:Stage 0 sporulation protein A homolog n=1 Tax=Clostridium gelidum TaxID=704125 RepID=A0ABM7T6Z5_9CLOT|nr:response regulator [Clostridium gelidum]BCZ47773.1 DNA-binding response regulator [Clostridium gelidum]
MSEFCKILIVDDEFIMRQGITHMIDWEQEGFQFIGQASNGQEAIEIIKDNPPDIIISDILMPQMDGIELAKFVQEKYPQIQIIILSSFSDFEYVKSSFQHGAVDYILKPSLNPAELIKTLKKASSEVQNFTLPTKGAVNANSILNRLILGFDSNIDFDYLNTLFINPSFCLFGINAKNTYNIYDKRNKMLDFIISEIDQEFSSKDVNQNQSIQLVNIENEIIVFVINFHNENYSNIVTKLAEICDTVSRNFPEVFFVLSKKFDSIANIKTVYDKDFSVLTQQYFYNKNIHFLCSENFEIPPSMDKFNFKSFSESIAILQISNAFEMLTQYIIKAISNKSLTEFELKTLIQNSFYNAISNLEYLNFDPATSNILKRDCFDKIDNSRYAEDLMLNYESILSYFTEIIEEHKSKITTHMINKIIQYIHAHYDEQLNLTDVSKLFNFNYYYLSSYFSSHNKEGFNEFLNKIRIEKACDFLKQDIPISDISSMVGYSDHSYFCKVFKKFTGLTPSNFRKNGIKIND